MNDAARPGGTSDDGGRGSKTAMLAATAHRLVTGARRCSVLLHGRREQ